MPLIVKDYTWEESSTHVSIDIPLKGSKSTNIDVFNTDNFIKVNYLPYFFECLTLHPFEEEQCKIVVGNGLISFTLIKKEPGIWGDLKSPDMEDKEKMRWHRQEAIRIHQERMEKKEKEREETKRQNDKFALDAMIKLDQAERDRIEAEKTRVRMEAAAAVDRLKAEMAMEEARRQREARLEAARLDRERARAEETEIFATGDVEPLEEIVAPLRKPDSIRVTFTERVFPTPVRESTTPAEQEWLEKQAAARRCVEVDDADLAAHDKDPVWLRDKGNSFFAAGNFQAAVNVYSHAIGLKCEWHSLYSNRAACHLKLRNLHKALEDSSRALDLLNPPVPANQKARVRAHIRRGTAFCELEMYSEGLLDYEAALKLDPDNASLRTDTENIRSLVEREG